MMAKTDRAFLPAAGRDVFLPLYDPLTKLLGFDAARRKLLDQAALQPNHRVLDVGCGTGSLAIQIKRRSPDVDVVGVDPDPKALARARRKAARAAVSVRFDRGFADALEYGDRTFDRLFCSMMFHHIPDDRREPALREMRRVLEPGGRLQLLDFSRHDPQASSLLARMGHAHELRENVDARILELLTAAGFAAASIVSDQRTLFGRIAFYQASS